MKTKDKTLMLTVTLAIAALFCISPLVHAETVNDQITDSVTQSTPVSKPNGVIPIVTSNELDKAVWVTIYDPTGLIHLDYGCMPAHGMRTWTSGNYIPGVWYLIKGETTNNADCTSPDGGAYANYTVAPMEVRLDQKGWHTIPMPPDGAQPDNGN